MRTLVFSDRTDGGKSRSGGTNLGWPMRHAYSLKHRWTPVFDPLVPGE